MSGNPDPHIDDWIDAAHPGLGPKTPRMTDARMIQNTVDPVQKPMPPESFNAKARRQAGKFKSFGDTVKQGMKMLGGE